MAVVASDQVTLQRLATPRYIRTYYRLQSSTLTPPAAPTTNPPASPWSTTEPNYTAGSTDTLYTVQLTVWGDDSFEYGPVQKSSAYEAAKQAYNAAQGASGAAEAAQARADLAAFATFSTQRNPDQPNAWLRAWLWDNPTAAGFIPSYADILGKTANSDYITDSRLTEAGQFNLGDNYLGMLRTLVRVTATTQIAFDFYHDDACRIYVDGVSRYATATTYASGTKASASFSLSSGWHVIDILWSERSGGDGIYGMAPSIRSQVTEMCAPVSLQSTAADAAQALADAQAAATAAANAATTAATADGRVTVSANAPTTANGTGKPVGAVWFRKSGSNFIGAWEWSGSAWQSRTFTDAVLASLDVAKLSAGTANIGSAVAQKIAAASGQFIELDVSQLRALEGVLDEAVINKLWADVVVQRMSIAEQFIGENALLSGAVTARTMSADAIDGKTIRGAYMEAPTIASSANLGTGANVLADPDFQGAVDEHWVASGFLGDAFGAEATKSERLVWDQTYQQATSMGGTTTEHRRGDATIVTRVSPVERSTGSVLFTNRQWLNGAARTVSNPFKFTDRTNWPDSWGRGKIDPTWKAFTSASLGTPVAETTYLTNTLEFDIAAGETWTVQLAYAGLTDSAKPFVDAYAEIVNASMGEVLWSAPLGGSAGQNRSGELTQSFIANFTARAKFRVRATYTAAGSGAYRTVTGWAEGKSGSNAPERWTVPSGWYFHEGTGPSQYNIRPGGEVGTRASTSLTLKRAMVGKVTPEKGYRIDQENGFQLFSTSGAQTGRLDGEDNFLAGTFATAESGQRVEMDGDTLTWYDQYGQVVANLAAELAARLDGSYGPYRMAAGTFATTQEIGSGGGFVDVTVTFPSGRFTQPPILTVSAGTPRFTVSPQGVSTSGCTLRIFNPFSVDVSAGQPIRWQAVQMTKESNSG